MPNIITALPKYSDGEIERELIKEIKTGFRLEKETERFRVQEAAREAATFRGHKTMEGLGKMVANMPAREYFRLRHKYGDAEMTSKGFLRYFQKKFPELSPNKV
jgi:hypothetical protein